jgi:hypothetical protein
MSFKTSPLGSLGMFALKVFVYWDQGGGTVQTGQIPDRTKLVIATICNVHKARAYIRQEPTADQRG